MVFQRHFAKVLDVEPERIELDHVGLNHLTWEVAVRLDGDDVLPSLLGDEHADRVARATGLPAAARAAARRRAVVLPALLLRP